jgi:hypothetical protein
MLPPVSEPNDTATSSIGDAIPDPDEDPFGKYGFVPGPPLPDQPEAMFPQKCAHSKGLPCLDAGVADIISSLKGAG